MTAASECFPQESPPDLAAILNQFFAPQATTARLSYQPDRWRILLEGPEPPDQNQALQVLRKVLPQVALPPGIEVYGRQSGVKVPAWGVRIKPKLRAARVPSPVIETPALEPGLAATTTLPLPEAPAPSPDFPTGPGIFLSSLGMLLALGTGLWWLSPSTWIERAPIAAPPDIQAKITRMITTIAPEPAVKNQVKNQARVLAPPARFRGKTMTQISLPATRKVVALTFDDGPDPQQTPQVLKILKQAQVKATFFVIGRSVEAFPKVAQQIVAEGHIIANHAWSHRYHHFSAKAAAAEIDRTTAIIEKVTGQANYWFRPPGGRLDNGLVQYAQRDQQAVMMWSVDPRDWEPGRSSRGIQTTVVRQTRPGGIVLLHDGGGPRQATIKALPGIIADLKKQGYEFVTIPELLELSEELNHPRPRPVDWLGVTSMAQLETLATQLAAEKETLHQALFQASPLDIPQRESLATEFQQVNQAHRWVSQRWQFEHKAQGAWESALNYGQQAATAGKTQDFKVARQAWQHALTALKTIPQKAFLAPQAELKRQEYQTNLEFIQRKIEQQESQFLLPLAQQAGLSDNATLSLCDANRNCYSLRGDAVLPSAASLIKLPLAVATLHWATEQNFNLERALTMNRQNQTEDVSRIRAGQSYPLQTVLNEMISRSSNIAPNQLMDTVGWDYLNRVMQQYGYSSIKIYSKLVGQHQQPANLGRRSNATSTRDLSRLMGQIYQNQLPQAPFLQNILAQQQDREIGYAALQGSPAQWLGEKTGQNSLVIGTVLAFQVRGKIFTLAIMDSNRVSVKNLNQAIRAVADYVVDHPEKFQS